MPIRGAQPGPKKAICREYAFEGVFPLDNELDFSGLSKQERGLAVSRANEALMGGCDLLIANLTPFRGPSADVGTVFELGFMRALGKPTFAYSNVAESFLERTKSFLDKDLRKRCDGTLEDMHGMALEDFDLADNLMIDGGATLFRRAAADDTLYTDLAAFRECVAAAAAVVLNPDLRRLRDD